MVNKSLKKILNKNQILKLNKHDFQKRPSELKPSFYYNVVELYEGK